MKGAKESLLGGSEISRPEKSYSKRVTLARTVLTAILVLVIWRLLHFEGNRILILRPHIFRYGNNDFEQAQSNWRWNEIESSTELLWHRCYEDYDCARLELPLDWLNETDPRQATIAIIRYNATDRENYNGPVFINPGGPGGSGVWFIKRLAPYYQYVVGRNHDIISFDPRGVSHSTPSGSCWPSTISTTTSYLWDLTSPPVVDAHPGAIYDAHTHATAFSQQCYTQLSNDGRFVSTASVARDMLHIVEKLGEEKLKYWGFSYGTFLGVTFASLFPEKVGRMVNDGNVDATNFACGNGTHFLADAEAVMDSFYHFCHAAGPVACSFYSSTPSAISSRLSSLLSKLKINPVIVASSSINSQPEIVTFSRVRRVIASSLYRPLFMFPDLATALSALENGDGIPFIELFTEGQMSLPLCEKDEKHENENDPSDILEEVQGSSDAGKAILCSDAPDLDNSIEGFQEYVDTLVDMSPSAGATMAEMRLGCVGWKIKAKWRFDGPFGANNTSNPILFLNPLFDNVTPHLSAVANSRLFPGSRLLVQNSHGHTSLSMPSKCTAGVVKRYFQSGELPDEGMVCEADLRPFDNWDVNLENEEVGGLELGENEIGKYKEDMMLEFSLRKLMMVSIM